MGQEQCIPIIDIPNVSFLRDRTFWQVSKTEEAWHPEELSKSGRHSTAEALGWKWFEDGMSLPTRSPQRGDIITIHHNSEHPSLNKIWKGWIDLPWVSQHIKDNDEPLLKSWSPKLALVPANPQYLHPRHYDIGSKVLLVSVLRSMKKHEGSVTKIKLI